MKRVFGVKVEGKTLLLAESMDPNYLEENAFIPCSDDLEGAYLYGRVLRGSAMGKKTVEEMRKRGQLTEQDPELFSDICKLQESCGCCINK